MRNQVLLIGIALSVSLLACGNGRAEKPNEEPLTKSVSTPSADGGWVTKTVPMNDEEIASAYLAGLNGPGLERRVRQAIAESGYSCAHVRRTKLSGNVVRADCGADGIYTIVGTGETFSAAKE